MKSRTSISIAILSCLAVLGWFVYLVLFPSEQDRPHEMKESVDSALESTVQGSAVSSVKVSSRKKLAAAGQMETADKDSSDSLKLEKVMDLPWGDAPGQVGRKTADESAPEGPMSFFVDDSGRIILLDQVNNRVQIFDEDQKPAVVNLPGDTYQDVSTTKDGDVVVMDRLARKDIETYGPDGKLLTSVPLEGMGVEEGGGVTGMFQREDGTWVEVEHSKLVRVADSDGKADADRPILPGRFSADGSLLLSAVKDSGESALILSRPSDSPDQVPTSFARVRFEKPLAYLTALESDGVGRVFVGAVLMEQPSGSGPAQGWDVIVAIDAQGRELGRLELPILEGGLEQFRSIRVGADGILYWLRFGPGGAQLVRIVL